MGIAVVGHALTGIIIPLPRRVVVAGQAVQHDLRPVVRPFDLHIRVIKVVNPAAVRAHLVKVDIGEDSAPLGACRDHLQPSVQVQIRKGIKPGRFIGLTKLPGCAVRFQDLQLFLLGDGRNRRRRLRRILRGGLLCASGAWAAGAQADCKHKNKGEDHFLHVRIISFDSNCSHYITPADYRTLKNS